MTTPALSHRENNFDFMRFLLAVAVIFSHSYDLLGGHAMNPLWGATGGQTDAANVAVDLFFVLSGFLIAQSFMQSKSVLNYFQKRVLRIYPAFIVSGLVCLFFFGPLPKGFNATYWEWVQPKEFLYYLATLQSYWVQQTFPKDTNHWPYVNSAVWTIQYEFLCYILVAVLGIAGVLRRRWFVLGLFAVTLASHVAHDRTHDALFRAYPDVRLFNYMSWSVGEWTFLGSPAHYPRFFTYFLAGTVFFLFRDKISLNLRGALLAGAALFFATFVYRGYEFVMPLAGTYLAFWFAFSKDLPLQRFGTHGDFSYGLYVYAWPVQQTIIWLFAGHIGPTALFLQSFGASLVLAVASWHCVEKPFLKLKARAKARPPARAIEPAAASAAGVVTTYMTPEASSANVRVPLAE